MMNILYINKKYCNMYGDGCEENMKSPCVCVCVCVCERVKREKKTK